ncbi:MAG: large conductance mechanosensitive channel protein MscL [Clostridia bacterium]|nr:large conductance mechanosensitive channel protein MscL [Clostridia bacterium]
MRKFFRDFKAFISRGNILDMAIGVIIGGAFSAIVTALTNKILMPLINWIVFACTGGTSVNLITVLNGKEYLIDDGAGNMIVNAECIYIDWGTFIIAIIDFLLIAIVLFMIIKLVMNAQGYVSKAKAERPTKEEKKALKEQGVNMRDRKAVLAATKALREANKVEPPAPKPTQEELLTAILAELQKQNDFVCECGEECHCHEEVVEEKPAKKERKTKKES